MKQKKINKKEREEKKFPLQLDINIFSRITWAAKSLHLKPIKNLKCSDKNYFSSQYHETIIDEKQENIFLGVFLSLKSNVSFVNLLF